MAQATRVCAPVLLLTAALFSLSANAAHAGITQYNSQASFTSSTTGITTVTFDGITPPGTFIGPGIFTQSGVTFQATSGQLFVVDPGWNPSEYGYGTGPVATVAFGPPGPATTPNTLLATLPGGVTAVGLNLAGQAGSSSSLTVTLTNGGVSTFTLTTPNQPLTWSFLGFTTDTGTIASISVTSSNNQVVFDNFQFGAAIAPVPEPGEFATAFALFGTTAMGMVTARVKARRRKTVASTVPAATS
jgi:hypothetical protein